MSTAVVTGVGVIAPSGIGADFWPAVRDGRRALGRLGRYQPNPYPVVVAGEVTGFEPEGRVDPRIAVQTDRFTHFALAATDLALHDAALDPAAVPDYRFGVVTASYSGGVEFGQREIQALWRSGPEHVGPYQSIAWFYAASSGQLSIKHGLRGPSTVLVADEAGGLDVFATARDELARGARAMLAGGAEAPFCPYSMCGQLGIGLLSAGEDPDTAYLPYTAEAAGFAPGEGGAVLVVEDADAAAARGAPARAVVAGHGATFTGIGRFPDSAEGLARAARQALADAGCRPEEVDVVFLDAIADPRADQAEAQALRSLFGDRAVPVTAPKTGYGRCYAGAAPLDVATAVLAIEHGAVPPTPGVTGCRFDLDLVTGAARPLDVRTALVLARGLHGSNSALVLRRPETS
ncbi:beta-ketoacyl synthase N-terminal-like domain-containing protein [Saccharothrix coeruleofusca]|uniref:Polyketide beta-ketoacyl synthase 2 n=1 Tax=Saccharothrix coeruleofusca TaxID=33919 RepID=A0A918AU71_9PSEU|nr:beta-ketoacyl synthase N-terminal-like domain-containing protein [Saccharothrix coeruleofusca]MBP2335484.1 minimal PKS chain-length factor (CLF/KS beta) [Saccharothrix coeruleofusca]GGP85361.1 putative polyketide beta-ketoacyl synthase 2 [Saccharothrix coeruleofusca]